MAEINRFFKHAGPKINNKIYKECTSTITVEDVAQQPTRDRNIVHFTDLTFVSFHPDSICELPWLSR